MEFRYSAIWRPGTGGQWFENNRPLDKFVDLDKQHMNEGLRLTRLQRWGARFFGVWRPGDGEERWHKGMNLDEFKKQDAEYFANFLRLHRLEHEGGP